MKKFAGEHKESVLGMERLCTTSGCKPRGSRLQMLACCRRMTCVVVSGSDERTGKEGGMASEQKAKERRNIQRSEIRRAESASRQPGREEEERSLLGRSYLSFFKF